MRRLQRDPRKRRDAKDVREVVEVEHGVVPRVEEVEEARAEERGVCGGGRAWCLGGR